MLPNMIGHLAFMPAASKRFQLAALTTYDQSFRLACNLNSGEGWVRDGAQGLNSELAMMVKAAGGVSQPAASSKSKGKD